MLCGAHKRVEHRSALCSPLNMKIYYAVFFIAASFAVPPANALAASKVVILDQGLVGDTWTAEVSNGTSWNVVIGQPGIDSTATGAVVSVNGHLCTLLGCGTANVNIIQYSDPTYYTVVGQCHFNANGTADGYYHGPIDVSTAGTVSGYGCTIHADSYVVVSLSYGGLGLSGGLDSVIGSTDRAGYSTNYAFCNPTLGNDPGPPCTLTGTFNGGTLTSFAPQFAITAGGFMLVPPNYSGLATSTCDITNLSGCFQNALVWAFVPPSGSLDIINSLWGTINTKPPFGYFTQTQNEISDIGASTTHAFSLGQITGIQTYIFDPLDEALAAIFWAIFGIWFFFNRVRHMQI